MSEQRTDDWRSYDRTAEVYERIWAPRFAEPARELVELAEISPGSKVLDVATGTGVAAAAAREVLGPDSVVIGADRSPGMLAAGLQERPGPRVVSEVVDLPFAEGTFDVVLCDFAIHLFPNYKTAMFDMLRVLRPGGRFGIATWGSGTDAFTSTWQELVESAIGEDMRKTARKDASPGWERFTDPKLIDEAFRDGGLRHIRIEKREYRFTYSISEYLEGCAAQGLGRFTEQMLGESGWKDFLERADKTFRENFPDPLTDFNDALLSVAMKP